MIWLFSNLFIHLHLINITVKQIHNDNVILNNFLFLVFLHWFLYWLDLWWNKFYLNITIILLNFFFLFMILTHFLFFFLILINIVFDNTVNHRSIFINKINSTVLKFVSFNVHQLSIVLNIHCFIVINWYNVSIISTTFISVKWGFGCWNSIKWNSSQMI